MKNKILKTTLISSLLATSLVASDSFINSLGINLAKAYSDNSQKDTSGTILLGNNPDKSFNSIELYATLNPILQLCKENNIRPTLSYTYSQNSDLKHQYLLVGVNKYYNHNSFELYAGILGGYGQIDWRYDPLNSSTRKNVDANSFIAGLQLGSNYKLNENWALNVNAKYLVHDYETHLKTTNATATIEHDSTASVGFGIEYSF